MTGNIDLWDVATSGVRIDSVHAGDYWRVTRSDHDWDDNRYWVGEDNWYTLGFYDDTVTTYASGDTLLIQLFAGHDVATFRLRLLDGTEDTIVGVSEPSGPLALNSTPQFNWSDAPSADFILWMFAWRFPSAEASSGSI